jgi:uncharacterized protein YcbX
MSPDGAQFRVASLHRYPVKSMLGETVDTLFVDVSGANGDRRWALVDDVSGHIASAKQARLWRDLLKCSARMDTTGVRIELPDGTKTATDRDDANGLLSALLGRSVHLVDHRPHGASIEHADADQWLDRGLDAEVDALPLELAAATPGDSFTDFAPLHAITTATLQRIGVEAARYRPNLVIATPPGFPPYTENEWTDDVVTVGAAQMRVLGPTPRCVIPTLEHGSLARATQALRTPAAENRAQSFDFGVLPCAGTYLAVTAEGTIQTGDPITLG